MNHSTLWCKALFSCELDNFTKLLSTHSFTIIFHHVTATPWGREPSTLWCKVPFLCEQCELENITTFSLQLTLSISIFIMSLPHPDLGIILLYSVKPLFMPATRGRKFYKNCSLGDSFTFKFHHVTAAPRGRDPSTLWFKAPFHASNAS